MKCVILAGGLGSRLSEETHRIPKPMVQIGAKPILWHIMKIYSHYGINDFIVCLGYKGYVVKEYFANYRLHVSDVVIDLKTGKQEITRSGIEPWKITLIDTGEDSMTGGRLGRVMHLLKDEEAFCLTYGDGVGDIDIGAQIAFHRTHGKMATVTAVPPAPRFGQLQINNGTVETFVEKPSGEGGLINGGFFVLSPKVARYLDGDATIWEHGPMRGLAADGEMKAWTHQGFWKPMDTLGDAQSLRAMWDGDAAPWKVWE